MTKTIKVIKFHRAIHEGYEPFITIDDYKAFIDGERVGFVRVSRYHTEDVEGRIDTEEVREDKQIDNEEVRRAIYQSIGG